MENLEISIGNKNKALILNEYNGELAILSAYTGSDGKTYWDMVFPRDSRTRAPREKAIPMKVNLGEPREAWGVLKQMLDYIEANIGKRPPRGNPDPVAAGKKFLDGDDDSDLPF